MIVEPCKILEVNFTNDHVYVPLVVNTSRLTRRMQLVEQELLTLPEHLNSPPVFSGVRVTRSLVVCVYFVDHCLSFFFWPFCCLFFFDIRIRITPLVSSNSSFQHKNVNLFHRAIGPYPPIALRKRLRKRGKTV